MQALSSRWRSAIPQRRSLSHCQVCHCQTWLPARDARISSRTSDCIRGPITRKQKAKRIYGVLERQFRKYFAEADRLRGNTGSNLLILLERRLDNAVFQLGFAESRSQARQFVAHGHVTVNGRKLDVSSYLVKVGDVIAPKSHKKSESLARERLEGQQGRSVLSGSRWRPRN